MAVFVRSRASVDGAERDLLVEIRKMDVIAGDDGRTYEPGASVSVVARRHDVNANQVFTWRRQFREGAGGGFLPVVAAPAGAPERLTPSGDTVAPDAPETGWIEIALSDGCRVIVDRTVDALALARVLAVLERR